MKSANETKLQNQEPEDIELEAENITQKTQLNTEEMDSESKKEKIYSQNKQAKFGYIKYVSLGILTVQNSALGLSMRYAKTRSGVSFSNAAAVLMTEILKLAICIVLVIKESGGIGRGSQVLYSTVILNIKDTLRVGVPSFLYVIQNNLLYVSASNLDAATNQVTYQLKLLTTAFFAVLVLKRRLKRWQWGALGLLVIGVALVQLTSTPTQGKMRSVALKDVEQDKVVKTVAFHLKKIGKVKVPEHMDLVKTGRFKELAPYDPDWFYVRCAAVLRHIYIRSPVGVKTVTKIFGGRKRNGVTPSHFCRSSGSIARKALQALEALKLVEKVPDGGRILTVQGRRDLDRIAAQVRHKAKQQAKQQVLVL